MAAPAWRDMTGGKRIASELKYMQAQLRNGHPQLSHLTVVNDDLHRWQFRLHNFDDDLPGGRQLNDDLKRLKREHNQDHMVMEVIFPKDYPHEPFLLRVVTPRCVMYTGHVTLGGSLCIQALVLTPGGWQNDYSFESILNLAIINMIDCESVRVMTQSGPGGTSGPLRIDFSGSSHHTRVMVPYSEAEARASHSRAIANHAVQGWGNAGGGSGTAAAPNAPSPRSRGRVRGAPPKRGGPSPPAVPQVPLPLPSSSTAAPQGSKAALLAPAVQAGAVQLGAVQSSAAAQLAGVSHHARGPGSGTAARRKRGRDDGRVDDGRDSIALDGAGGSSVIDLASDSDGTPAKRRRVNSLSQIAAPPSTAGMNVVATASATAATAAAVTSAGGTRAAAVTAAAAATVSVGAATLAAASASAAAAACATATAGAHAAAHHAVVDLTNVSQSQEIDLTSPLDDTDLFALLCAGVPDVDVPPAAAPRPTGSAAPLAATVGATARATAAATASDANGARRRTATAGVSAAVRVPVVVLDDCDQAGPSGRAGGTSWQHDWSAGSGHSWRSAKALEEDARLARQLEMEEKLAALQADNEALKRKMAQPPPAAAAPAAAKAAVVAHAPLPKKWVAMPDNRRFLLVDLPLGDGAGSSDGASDEAPAFKAALDELVQGNGLSKPDAKAALRYMNGDVDAALMFCVEASEKGGAQHVIRELEEKGRSGMELQQKEMAKEVATVMKRWTESGQAASKVIKIERIQHPRLWTKYQMRRSEVLEEVGSEAALTEKLLWHGSDPATTQRILNEGFDCRVALMTGALGAGTYFAYDSSYSIVYSMKGGAAAYYLPPAGGAALSAAPLDPQAAAAAAGLALPVQQQQRGRRGRGGRAGGGYAMVPPVVPPGTGAAPVFASAAAFATGAAPRAQAFGYNAGLQSYQQMAASIMASTAQIAAAGAAWGGMAYGAGAAYGSSTAYGAGGMGYASASAASTAASSRTGGGVVPASGRLVYVMMLCKVVLGRIGQSVVGQRRPPDGFDAVGSQPGFRGTGQTFAVFDNAQGVPCYLVHFV